METIITFEGVRKYYKIAKRGKGLSAAVGQLFNRQYEVKKAVDDISFSIGRGEIVGFIGPNGAGKSTTIKMLSGILYPDAGRMEAGGFIPYKQRKQYVKDIGVVFGQKSQLNWDLPLIESFELMKFIYRIPREQYEENLRQFCELLDMEPFLGQPVRQLSLGQRMRGDIVAALLHSPRLVFLDEPTIGLDVVAKEKIREFVRYMNQERDTTIIFTTHDMQDIEKVCRRLIIIDEGKKIYDGSIGEIKDRYTNFKTIEILLENGGRETEVFDARTTSVNAVLERIFAQKRVKDISIREPEIEGIIRDIYEGRLRLDAPAMEGTGL